MRTIVGLDMSYRHCGFAKVTYQRIESTTSINLLQTAVIETQGNKLKNTLSRIREEIHELQRFIIDIRAAISNADEVVIEMPYGSQSAISAKYLGYCYGLIAAIEINSQAEFIYVSPYDLKEWSGKRKNSKIHVQQKVFERLGKTIDTKNDNIIDALGLCLMRCDQISCSERQIKSNETSKQLCHPSAKQKEIRSRAGTSGDIQEEIQFLPRD